jgi:hypothetical protein
MRTLLFAAAIAVSAIACGTDLSTHVNALTGERCEPDGSYQPKPKKAPTNPKCQGTSNGDNCDDLSSGKIDCIGDGNSGQGDDKKHNCEFPQPGCDENGCCDDDIVEPPPGDGDPDDPGDQPPPGDEPPGDEPPPSDEPPPTGVEPPADPVQPPRGVPTVPLQELTPKPSGPIL